MSELILNMKCTRSRSELPASNTINLSSKGCSEFKSDLVKALTLWCSNSRRRVKSIKSTTCLSTTASAADINLKWKRRGLSTIINNSSSSSDWETLCKHNNNNNQISIWGPYNDMRVKSRKISSASECLTSTRRRTSRWAIANLICSGQASTTWHVSDSTLSICNVSCVSSFPEFHLIVKFVEPFCARSASVNCQESSVPTVNKIFHLNSEWIDACRSSSMNSRWTVRSSAAPGWSRETLPLTWKIVPRNCMNVKSAENTWKKTFSSITLPGSIPIECSNLSWETLRLQNNRRSSKSLKLTHLNIGLTKVLLSLSFSKMSPSKMLNNRTVVIYSGDRYQLAGRDSIWILQFRWSVCPSLSNNSRIIIRLTDSASTWTWDWNPSGSLSWIWLTGSTTSQAWASILANAVQSSCSALAGIS